MSDFAFSAELRDRLSTNLSGFDVSFTAADDLRKAAVAIVVTAAAGEDTASVLVTMRPQSMNRHSGQYALPGGRLDEGETDEDAALRELDEELGLRLSKRDILGRLDDFPTRSGFRIAPLVMWSETDRLTPDPNEVAAVFHLPLAELNSPEIPRLVENGAGEHPVLSSYFPTLGHFMYAPTAAVLYQFREVALRGKQTRAAHYEQPSFAWR